jgi:hypothetical protein
MNSFLSNLSLFARCMWKVGLLCGFWPGLALAFLVPRIRLQSQIAALRRCASKDAYKALSRELERQAERSREAGLKAAETTKKGRAA